MHLYYTYIAPILYTIVSFKTEVQSESSDDFDDVSGDGSIVEPAM